MTSALAPKPVRGPYAGPVERRRDDNAPANLARLNFAILWRRLKYF
jgi:hypothetical protein